MFGVNFFVAVERLAAYVASKHAMLGFTDSFLQEMPSRIAVGTIAPGFVGSELVSKGVRNLAMSPEEFAWITVDQIISGEAYVVSHSYNQVRIDERYDAIKQAYATFSPRQDGDEKLDVKTLMQQLAEQRNNIGIFLIRIQALPSLKLHSRVLTRLRFF